MRLPSRGPRVIDNSTGADVTPGRKGRHRRTGTGCTVTWGECDTRSNRSEDDEEQKLPHVCGESGDRHIHRCAVCSTPQA